MKKNLFFLTLALSALCAFAQTPPQNPEWVLKGVNNVAGNYLRFANLAPHHPTVMAMPTGLTQTVPYANSHNDLSGNFLFYILDGSVYNNGNYIGALYHNGSNLLPKGEIVVVPDPGNCKRYYLMYFTKDYYAASANLYYSIVDMSTGNYHLVLFEANTAVYLGSAPWSGTSWLTLAATKLRSNNTRFIFVHGMGYSNYPNPSNPVERFTVSAWGISGPDYIYPGTGTLSFGGPNVDSELEIWETWPSSGGGAIEDPANIDGPSQGGNLDNPPAGGFRIAGVAKDISLAIGWYVWEMELDANGNYIPGSFLYHSTGGDEHIPHGLEFSPNGNYLYYTHATDNNLPNPVEYLDLTQNGQNYSLLSSNSGTNLGLSQIEMGADQILYFSLNNRIGKLTSPNAPNANNYTDNANLGASNSYIFPDQIDADNYYSLPANDITADFSISSNCVNNVLQIEVASLENQALISQQQWYLIKGSTLVSQSTGTNPSSWIFSPVDPNTEYRVMHVVANQCNGTRHLDKYITTGGSGTMDPSFQLQNGNVVNHTYGLTATSATQNTSFTWTAEELDQSGNPISGTIMTSNDNPYWGCNSCTFQGYCCNGSSNTPGVFSTNRRYKIIHTIWSGCYAQSTMSIIFGITEGQDEDGLRIYSTSSDYVGIPGITGSNDGFDIYPNPASDLLIIRSNGSQEMTYSVTDMFGKVMIPSVESKGGNVIQLNVSDLRAGLYLLRNNRGATKKFVIQK